MCPPGLYYSYGETEARGSNAICQKLHGQCISKCLQELSGLQQWSSEASTYSESDLIQDIEIYKIGQQWAPTESNVEEQERSVYALEMEGSSRSLEPMSLGGWGL